MLGFFNFNSRQIRGIISSKTATFLLLNSICGFSSAATAMSSVVLTSPVNVMAAIANIAPVISISAGWVTIRLSVPQSKQASDVVPALKDETAGRPMESLDKIDSVMPNMAVPDVLVSYDRGSLSLLAESPELALGGQPIASLNFSRGNAQLDAAGMLNTRNSGITNDYKLTVVFN
jgi:hypothetical protein